MARIRTIKPSFWLDAKVLRVSIGARYLMIGLISYADDEGYQQQNAESLSACVFGGSESPSTTRAYLAELETVKLIDVRLDTSDNEFWLISVINFREHQYISKAKASRLKDRFHDVPPIPRGSVAPLNDDVPPEDEPTPPKVDRSQHQQAYREDVDFVIFTLQNRCPQAEKITHSMAGSILKWCQAENMHPDYVMSRVPGTHTNPFLYIRAALTNPVPADRLSVPSEMRRTHSWNVFWTRQRKRGQPMILGTVLAKMAGDK